MEISVDLNRVDYSNFVKYYYLKKRLKRSFFVLITMGFALQIILPFGKDLNPLNYFVYIIISSFSFLTLAFIWILIIIKLSGWLPSKNGAILGKRTFYITNDGFKEISDKNINIQNWKGIESIEENKNYVFIFIDKIAAYIIPKKAFRDKNEQQEFINTINDHMYNAV